MVCCLLSEWYVATLFYQRSANRVSFYDVFYLRNLLYLIKDGSAKDIMPVPGYTRVALTRVETCAVRSFTPVSRGGKSRPRGS